MSQTSKKPFYGWYIVVSGFMIMCFGMCVIMNCPSMFVKPVSEDLGISRQAFSMNSTMVSIAMMVVSFNAGKIFSRFSVKQVLMVSSVTMAATYALYAFAKNITMFYVVSAMLGVSLALISSVPCAMLITRWFNKKRGFAMGIMFMGSGVGGVILNPLIGALIPTVGWRKTYLVLALLMFVFIAPCAFFLVKNDPAELGLEPYGGREVITAGSDENNGITLQEAWKDLRFWAWLPVTVITNLACSGAIQQITSYVTDIGYSFSVAANIAAANLGLLAIGKILLGQAYDKLGTKKASFLTMLCLLVGFSCLPMAKSFVFLAVFLLLFGFGCAFATVAYPIVTAELFGKKDYGAIYGIVNVGGSLGTAIGSPLAAAIFDRTGSYNVAWSVDGVLIVVNLLLLAFIFLKSRKPAATVQ